MTYINIEQPKLLIGLCEKIEKYFDLHLPISRKMELVASELSCFGGFGVRALINQMLQSTKCLEKISENSYVHENGFYKITLISNEKFTLRLHIWLPGLNIKETLHDHRWYLASTVVNGCLVSEIWGDVSLGEGDEYDEYRYIDKFNDPELIGKASVKYRETVYQKVGQSYTLDPSVLHRIITSGKQMTATLMCRSGIQKPWARNIIVNDLIPDVKPKYLSPEKLSGLFEKYLELDAEENQAFTRENPLTL